MTMRAAARSNLFLYSAPLGQVVWGLGRGAPGFGSGVRIFGYLLPEGQEGRLEDLVFSLCFLGLALGMDCPEKVR